ncbi:LolA family protein [Paraliomyxa miuraensis]|uniref:LolA family protein n=1 Tax=Paraliomyxa miuraensis TaxID=376150 RepID=UPI00225A0379|nr:outer membrane lipoprotein carrier protein LolA [Paraliomyxa miuraensis]MCX4247044.1 outer membrane lipoprotein carrier protein LolA [Paraliomyxa miuraensis]
MHSKSWSMGALLIAGLGLLPLADAAEPPTPAEVAAPATERDDIDALMARLGAMPGVYARFTEEKTIGLLAKPLVNHGTLHYMPPGKLLRTVETPYKSQVLLVGDAIFLSDGPHSERIDLGTQPAARSFVGSFRSLLAGDRQALAEHFELSLGTKDAAVGLDGEWTLELRPRTQGMARIVTKMRISGRGEVVTRLLIEEASGDVSDTKFFEVDPRREYPADVAAKLFRPPA